MRSLRRWAAAHDGADGRRPRDRSRLDRARHRLRHAASAGIGDRSGNATWAVATPPQPSRLRWQGKALIWEATEHYLYLRTTADHRHRRGWWRRRGDQRTGRSGGRDPGQEGELPVLARLRRGFFPMSSHAPRQPGRVSGTTEDGLPDVRCRTIRVSLRPTATAATAHSTFGFLAAELIAGVIGGRCAAWYDDFPVAGRCPARSSTNGNRRAGLSLPAIDWRGARAGRGCHPQQPRQPVRSQGSLFGIGKCLCHRRQV